MKSAIIISGGSLNTAWLKEWLNTNKYNLIIAVDKGLEALDLLNIEADYIIGDFDSIDTNVLKKYNKNVIKLNPEKDFTDTHEGLKLAISLECEKVDIVGAIGTRIDHVLANINILKEPLEKNIKTRIIDENNQIFLINRSVKIKKDDNYKYLSIIPLTTTVEGITLKGFKYLLNNYILNLGQSIGVSNEQLKEEATIELKKGILIVIFSKD